MFVTRVGRALICVGVLVVVQGATPSGPSVTIADSGLTPPDVTVPAGGSVVWTNQGTRQHQITAAGDAFPHFSLAPEGTRSVAFMKPGRYPYLLDGAVKGMVVVVAGGGGAGAGGPGDGGQSSTSPPGCLTIYRYDVRVAVHREAKNSLPPAFAGSGTTQKVTGWKASFVKRLSVDRCGAIVEINTPAVHDDGGQFDGTFDWNDATELYGYTKKLNANDTTKSYAVPPCHYTYASHVPAFMSFRVGDIAIGQTGFDFLAGQDLSDQTVSKAEFEREADAKYAACDDNRHRAGGGYTPIGDAGMPLDGFNGMLIGDNQLHLTFNTPPNSPVKASILDSLVAGKSFNYDTGLQVYQHKGGDWELSESVRATVSFSRLEN